MMPSFNLANLNALRQMIYGRQFPVNQFPVQGGPPMSGPYQMPAQGTMMPQPQNLQNLEALRSLAPQGTMLRSPYMR